MSGGVDPDREIARSLRLRGELPPVTRLSRRALALLAGVAAVAVAAVVGWSLMDHRKPPATAPDPAPTPAAAPAQLNELPKDYASLPPGVPKLGPPLPGDLGKPFLQARADEGVSPSGGQTVGGSTDARLEQAKSDALQARRSSLAVATSRMSPAPPAAADGMVSSPVSEPASRTAGGPGPLDPTHVLQAGTVIRAALITGIRSDLSGLVTAQVTEDVFDSLTGQVRLLPQGARLIGTYDSHPTFGQGRVQVSWTRILLPDGRSVSLDHEPTADAQGYAGLEDQVDRHWRRLAGASLISSLLGMGATLGAGSGDSQLLQALRTGAAGATNQAGQQLVGKTLDAAPSLTVRPGWPVRVLVTKDLVVEPEP